MCTLSAHDLVVVAEVCLATSEKIWAFYGDSREKQKMLRENGVGANLNAAADSLPEAPGKVEAELKVNEAKQRLDKHR